MMTHTLGFPRMDFEDRAQRGLYFGHKEKPRHAHGKKHFLTRAEFVTDAGYTHETHERAFRANSAKRPSALAATKILKCA